MASLGRPPSSAPLNSADIPDNSITASKIADGAVGIADIGENAVGTSEIADSVTLVTPNLGAVASGNLSNTAIVYPAGHVIQTKRIYLRATTSTANLTYATSSSALNGTLDSHGIWRLKNADGEYFTIPSFSATSGNMLVGWYNYAGIGATASASAWSLGIEWGGADKRTWVDQGYNNTTYLPSSSCHTSIILGSNLSNVNIHGVLRMEELNKTMYFRHNNSGVSATNFGTEGTSLMTVDWAMTIMEIQQ